MKDNDKLIQDWQEHVRASFGQESRLYEYLFETLNNFYYRYLETSTSQNLKTEELAPKTYGALSFEANMREALKDPNPDAKAGIIEMAKSIPHTEKPAVRYGLWVQVLELTQDRGHLRIIAEINWDFPEYQDREKRLQKQVDFKYDELAEFRKQLALKLEEASELF